MLAKILMLFFSILFSDLEITVSPEEGEFYYKESRDMVSVIQTLLAAGKFLIELFDYDNLF